MSTNAIIVGGVLASFVAFFVLGWLTDRGRGSPPRRGPGDEDGDGCGGGADGCGCGCSDA
ncbi:hypothetical protein ACIBEA_09410 [Streptomyces sp. NPDC051555]|uniref:hypothetical protein n=1 Tax=Streptomyces sp. NPDC051555 TaxID=3365657 RepID=UPI0037BB1FA9